MAVEPVAAAHAADQVALARRTADELGRLWRQLDRGSIAASWRALLPRALSLLVVAQTSAADAAGRYVADVADEYDLPDDAPQVVGTRFAGVASDGRDLASLLYRPAIVALTQIREGATPARATAAGRFTLDLISRTQVADAGRAADGVAIAARPQLTGYVRMVVGATCARCLILAGRRYRWNAGFNRHPRCDCRHVPVAEDVPDDVRTDPRAYFDGLDRAAQDRLLGVDGAQAVRDGADMAKVVNARRGMVTAGGRVYTTEAAGRRPRLMPEQIYLEARGDRDDAVRLLRLHGYVR